MNDARRRGTVPRPTVEQLQAEAREARLDRCRALAEVDYHETRLALLEALDRVVPEADTLEASIAAVEALHGQDWPTVLGFGWPPTTNTDPTEATR